MSARDNFIQKRKIQDIQAGRQTHLSLDLRTIQALAMESLSTNAILSQAIGPEVLDAIMERTFSE